MSYYGELSHLQKCLYRAQKEAGGEGQMGDEVMCRVKTASRN